jgi:hypothetical protein
MVIPVVRTTTILSLLVLLISSPLPGQTVTQGAFEKSLLQFQQTHRPELFRYSGLTTFGESLSGTRPSPKEIEALRAFLDQAIQSGAFEKPSIPLAALIHELLVWAPDMRASLLQRLITAPYPEDPDLEGALFVGILASGQAGEETVIGLLASKDQKWQAFAQSFLSKEAVSPTSARRALELSMNAPDPAKRVALLAIVTQVGEPTLAPALLQLAKEGSGDEVQAAAIFGVVELQGYSALPFLASLRTHGPKAEKELREGVNYLKNETNSQNPFGMAVSSDSDFSTRFSDLKTPSLNWLRDQGLLSRKELSAPRRLTATETDQLMSALIESKGFGLEVAKGYLFRSLEPRHIDALIQLREVNWISPNNQSRGRDRTLKILIRGLRRGLPKFT